MKNGNGNGRPTPGPTATVSPTQSPIVDDDHKREAEKEEKAKDMEPRPPDGLSSLIGRVQRQMAIVRVNGIDLKNDMPQKLFAGARVSTIDEGEASLNLGGCGTVHLFRKSRLILATCRKSLYGKSTTCATEGNFTYNNSCVGKFKRTETPSSEIELLGTNFGVVVYSQQDNLSLVTVSEGAVTIRPVIDMKKRILGDKSEPITSRFFYYTTPGIDPVDIGGVSQRSVRPNSELPKLLKALEKMPDTKDIRDRIEDIRKQGEKDLLLKDDLPPTGRIVIPPPSVFNFASSAVGVPQTKEIVLAVKDEVPVTFKPFTIGGVNHSDFKLTADECSGKIITTRCTLKATFTPLEAAKHQATLNISSNADNSPSLISLLGTVGAVGPGDTTGPGTTGPGTTGPGTPTPKFSVTESSTFEIRKIFTPSPPKVITVTNEGPAPILVTGVQVKTVGGNFKSGTDNCLNQKLEPQGKCTVEILYTPQTEGPHKANLLITAKSTSPVAIGISQPVASKSAELSGTAGMPLANFAPDVLCFDRWKKVKSGDSTIRQRLWVDVRNSGTAPLTVTDVAIAGPNKLDFSVTDNTCRSVDINGDCRITVGFTPTEEKVRKGSLVITHDGSSGQNQVPLAGVGKPRNWFLRLIDRLRSQKKPC